MFFFVKKCVVRYKIFKTESKGFFWNRSHNYQKNFFIIEATLFHLCKLTQRGVVRNSVPDYKIEASDNAEFRK